MYLGDYCLLYSDQFISPSLFKTTYGTYVDNVAPEISLSPNFTPITI